MDRQSSRSNSQNRSNHKSEKEGRQNKNRQPYEGMENQKDPQACDKNDQNCNE